MPCGGAAVLARCALPTPHRAIGWIRARPQCASRAAQRCTANKTRPAWSGQPMANRVCQRNWNEP